MAEGAGAASSHTTGPDGIRAESGRSPAGQPPDPAMVVLAALERLAEQACDTLTKILQHLEGK